MSKNPLFLVVLGILTLIGGCSDDPPPAPLHDPATAASTAHSVADGGAGEGGAASSSTPFEADGDGTPANVDAGYRDPVAIDGGCAAPNMVCGGKCVAVGSDSDNCGACGNKCIGDGAQCQSGTCGCFGVGMGYCPAQGGCVDLQNDDNNCGTCGTVCQVFNFGDMKFGGCSSGACIDPNSK